VQLLVDLAGLYYRFQFFRMQRRTSVKAIFSGLLLCFAAQATITFQQEVTSGTSCSGTSGTSCAVTVSSIGSGHILIAMFGSGTVSTVTDTAGNNWKQGTNCAIANVDCWYVLSSTSSTNTTITGNLVTSGAGRALEFYEFSIGAGCVALLDSSSSASNLSSTSQSGIAFSALTGTNDVIVQQIFANANVSSISPAGYTAAATGIGRTAAYFANTVSGAAPTWTLVAPATANVNAIAISEACSAPITVAPATTTLSSSLTQQFTATLTSNGNTTPVTWSITSSPVVGSIDQYTGIYTAPASISPAQAAQPVTVTATTQATPPLTNTATITLVASTTLQQFSLNELFGVGWPNQPIEFAYNGTPAGAPTGMVRMMGPGNVEVPYQWVSSCSAPGSNGCILVRSSLPANSSYTWTLQSGQTPAASPPTNPVQMNTVGSNIEITNGLTGIRILNSQPGNAATNPAPSPIQGICYQQPCPGANSWTGAGAPANLLYSQSAAFVGNLGEPLSTAIGSAGTPPALTYTVTPDPSSGPLKTVVTVNYTFTKPPYQYGNVPVTTGNTGHYTLIVTMYANSKSVLIDEDTDMVFSYYLPLYQQLTPDTARWRGNNALDGSNVPDPICGYESPLTINGASGGTPVVITTSTSGNMSNGQAVLIVAGVPPNAAATGTLYYAKTTGYPANQFALYSDPNLTVPVGPGAYRGGGTVKPAYRGQALTPNGDAFQDLSYNLDRPANYSCTANSYRKLLADYPVVADAAGWYVEMYNSAAGQTAPVVGFYVGRASKQLYSATGSSLPGIYTSNRHFITGAQAAGIQVDTLLRGPDGTTPCGNTATPPFTACEAVIHRNWGIYVSTQADFMNPPQTQYSVHYPIADEQNTLTGINLSHLYTYRLVYPEPNPGAPQGGWQPLYLSAATATSLQNSVQNGTTVCGSVNCYYNLLKGSEGSNPGQALLEMWQGNSAAAVQTALNAATGLAVQLETALTAGDNHFDATLAYYQLGLYTSPYTAVLNAILVNANTTATQRTLAKAELALFGSIFWDDDWFPIPEASDNNYASGEGDGLANQIQQYLEYRAQSVFAAGPTQPFLSQQLTTAEGNSTQDFSNYFDSTGAAAGSTHYQSAFFEPLILNYMNLSQNQPTVALNTYAPAMSDPKWAAYANWELSIQTPPEPRFGNIRKGYSNGDGNTESDVRTGMLGTALNPVNPALAGNLMWAWQQSNRCTTNGMPTQLACTTNGVPALLTEDSQFVTTLAAIDPTITPVMPQLSSINIPGYHSVERANFNTPNETALWFINGGFYQTGGHRHYDDGQVSIYAHSAPLAIDWNANLYYPETPGRIMHNSIVYDNELGVGGTVPWNSDNLAPTLAENLMQSQANTEFAAFRNSTTSSAAFISPDGTTTWTRTVRMMNFDPSYPIIYVNDSFAGSEAATGKTLTWNLMATGAVSTPVGSQTPTTRFSTGCQSPAGALPSTGPINLLTNGLNHFNFTGVTWLAHATQGIDWDLFVPNSGTGEFLIGNWGHGCHSSRETSEYQTANNGATFAETQHILRVHDTGPFTTVILPYRKTETPTRTVTQQACGTQIAQTTASGTETTCFNGSMAMYAGNRSRMFTLYDTTTQSAFGFTASGGPQEVTVQSDQIVWTIGGCGVTCNPTGATSSVTRSLTLPGNWYPNNAAVTRSGNTFSYTYAGGQQTAPVTITFSQLPLP
jgi:hypothetical protein